ncbi:MAG: hypothetical protein NVS3B19_16790 [Ginsengibacter sp.]
MVIVVNTTNSDSFEEESYLVEFFENLAQLKPSHHFHFISSSTISKRNIDIITLKYSSKPKGIVKKIKYHYELRKTIRKFSPDILITTAFVPGLKSITQQYLLIGQIGLKKKAGVIVRNLQKIAGIITTSESWCELLKTKGVAAEQIIVTKPFSCNEYLKDGSLNTAYENEEQYDFPFLLLIDNNPDPDRVVLILKSFSAFKKRLKSSMKLLIPVADNNKLPLESLIKSYKYRNDVSLIPELVSDSLSSVATKSYAVIINSDEYGFINPASTLLSVGSVIIAANSIYNNVREYTGDNAFYYMKGNSDELSEILIRLYKDEELRNRFVLKKSKADSNKEKDEQLEVLARKLLLT